MQGQQSTLDIRPSSIAGRWYPGNARQLASAVESYMAQAEVSPVDGRIVAVLAPHAGHHYSGPVAGYAFKLLRGLPVDTVVVVGPSHYAYSHPIITTGHAAYQTPLGKVPVDHALLNVLREDVPIQAVRNDQEHSLEIELPFLQCVLESFQLVPLALVDQSLDAAERLGGALACALADKQVLLVASSDLSHFYPQATANRLDQTVLDAVAAYDPVGVIEAEKTGSGFACGRGAIATVMIAARQLGADTAQILNYATSGDVTHDFNQVVGYGAAVFYQAPVASH